MQSRLFRRPLAGLLVVGLASSVPGGARAQQDVNLQPAAQPETQPSAAPPAQAAAVPKPVSGGLSLSMGSGRIVRLPHPVASIFAADPSVVEVRPASPTSLFMFGKGLGETNVIATDANGNTVAQYAVTVGPSHFASDRVAGQAGLTGSGAHVTAEGEPGGMIVRGTVQTPEQASQVMGQAKLISPTGTVTNDLQVKEPIQVELKVRIAYMSRSVTRQFGIDWSQIGSSSLRIGKFFLAGAITQTGTAAPTISGTSPGTYGVGVSFPHGSFEGVIDALASDNLAHIVAEPTLTTLSGTQANFLVGGQFPVPVSQSGTGTNTAVSVTFKNYGVQLSFTPTVFSDGRISLQVSPQLSQLSSANSVTQTTGSSALVIPALTVQAASTTVILGSGEGMAIAGLLADNTNQTDNAVPGLGEVPVLGALFRGDSFQREQQELVITVTPYLVNPVNNPGLLASPDDGWTPPNDMQRILLLRDNGAVYKNAAIPGDAGFVVQ
ncbi:MAG TPA: type II and III secretion system protein family protein [Acidocella sp.]|nr:type II and III secretion system protein family protein [Acidocella sp.]